MCASCMCHCRSLICASAKGGAAYMTNPSLGSITDDDGDKILKSLPFTGSNRNIIDFYKHAQMTCILEFDGASKGNPGKAGAAAVLRKGDGSVVSCIREGLGIATNNVAEYRALILGMKYALMKGFKHIQAQGDSQLICMQVQDLWQAKNQNMAALYKEVKRFKEMFQSFNIIHVKRGFNAVADNLAYSAITLPVGEVCEDRGPFN